MREIPMAKELSPRPNLGTGFNDTSRASTAGVQICYVYWASQSSSNSEKQCLYLHFLQIGRTAGQLQHLTSLRRLFAHTPHRLAINASWGPDFADCKREIRSTLRMAEFGTDNKRFENTIMIRRETSRIRIWCPSRGGRGQGSIVAAKVLLLPGIRKRFSSAWDSFLGGVTLGSRLHSDPRSRKIS